MNALGNGGLWWNFSSKRRRSPSGRKSKPSDSVDGRDAGAGGGGIPFKQKATAASLALVGDTVAQLRERWKTLQSGNADINTKDRKDALSTLCSIHDWRRAFGMASYGFLLYGPGSYVWYRFLDRRLPDPTFVNMSMKVLLNQIILGPCVIAVAFGWNSLWQQKLSQLPSKYQKDAFPTLLYGFRFWIPVSILNFSVVPLETRVAFMSTCAIFWNFYLSSTMNK